MNGTMTEHEPQHDPHPEPAEDGEPPFGTITPSRFAADVEYTGRAGEHDYIVRVRHRLLDTTFTLEIDGIEHDPKAEQKAQKAREKDREAADDPADDNGAEDSADALQFHLEESFSTLRCTVRRRREGGEVKDCERLTITTTGLGGAGEVEIRHGFRTTLLLPANGSPSALRDEKRTAHPTRYALIAALTKGAKYLIPLLGLGALLSGLLDPVEEWIEERIRVAVDAVMRATQPIREWIGEVTRPVREFLDALLSPVRELIAAILRPIGDALRWLLGLLPDISLPFSVPGWVLEVLLPLLVVLAVFSATYSGLKRRREKLAESAGSGTKGADTAAGERSAEAPDQPSRKGGTDRTDGNDGADATEGDDGADATDGVDQDDEIEAADGVGEPSARESSPRP